jgi:hypothetical protein
MSVLDQSAQAINSALDPIAASIRNPFQQKVAVNGEMPQDFPQGFFIIEYVNGFPQDGALGRPNTIIKLVGNMMPKRPFPWEVEQRIVKEHYAGNPEPAVQILGSKRGDLIIKGTLKDKRYKDPSWYGVSYKISKQLEEMADRGNLVKFGMHGNSGSWVRYGFLLKAHFDMEKMSKLDYELTFSVVSDKQPRNNYFAVQDKTAPNSVNQNLINAATAFQSSYSSIPSTMPQSIAGVLNNIISGVAKNINTVTGFVNTAIATATEIQASANRAIGLIRNLRTQLVVWRRQVGNLAHGFSSLSNSGSTTGQFTDTQKNLSFTNNMHASMTGIEAYLAQMQKQFEMIARTVPIGRYRVQQGDTLQRISVKYYGKADNWNLIYDHNKLQSTALNPGDVLEIPRA